MPTIRIDDEVMQWLKGKAEPFEDTPNSVLRRVAGLDPIASARAERVTPSAAQSSPRSTAKTPQGSYRAPLLDILLRNGGKLNRTRALSLLEAKISSILTSYDREDIKSGTLRWQKSAEWEVSVMRMEGVLLPKTNSPHGYWVLSPLGERLAKEALT